MEPAASDAPVLTDNPAASRYEVHVGPQLAGFVDYRLNDRAKTISLVHTEVEPAFEGHRLGAQLARYSLDDARQQGLAVLPFCPYITTWIRKHPEYADLVPVDRRADFGI